eukprot:scaffold2693_cov139-Isochrysis_galbana.AAC.7
MLAEERRSVADRDSRNAQSNQWHACSGGEARCQIESVSRFCTHWLRMCWRAGSAWLKEAGGWVGVSGWGRRQWVWRAGVGEAAERRRQEAGEKGGRPAGTRQRCAVSAGDGRVKSHSPARNLALCCSHALRACKSGNAQW